MTNEADNEFKALPRQYVIPLYYLVCHGFLYSNYRWLSPFKLFIFFLYFFSLFAVFIHCLASFWSFDKAVVWQPKAYFVLNFQPEKALIVFFKLLALESTRGCLPEVVAVQEAPNLMIWLRVSVRNRKFWNCRKPADRRCKLVLTCCLVWRNICLKRLNVSAENLKKEHGDVWLTSNLKFSFLSWHDLGRWNELQGASCYHF